MVVKTTTTVYVVLFGDEVEVYSWLPAARRRQTQLNANDDVGSETARLIARTVRSR